jgi:heterodisulfide reductase subunit A-like polyferredoxin
VVNFNRKLDYITSRVPRLSPLLHQGVREVMDQPHDVAIVGGGVAGLSAALVLGRWRRSVWICDDRENSFSPCWTVSPRRRDCLRLLE